MKNRRNFIKKTGLITAGTLSLPTLISASAIGKNPPSDRITIGMIGTGRQAFHPNLTQFLESPNAQVVALNDVDSFRLQQAANKTTKFYEDKNGGTYRGIRLYSDYRELLNNPEIDAVMISTPDHWHVPMGIAAAMAGKHVCMEKALTTCINHSKALRNAVHEFNVVHRLDSEFRSLSKMHKAVELVHNGAIGKLKEVVVGVPSPMNGSAPEAQPNMPVPTELDYDQWLGPAFPAPYTEKRVHERHKVNVRPGWMRINEYCNGMITNWGAHLIDIAVWGLKREKESPVSVEGSGQFTQGLWNTIEKFNLTYRYADGLSLRYIIDTPYTQFIGDDGWIKIGYPDKLEVSRPELLKISGSANYQDTLSDKEDFLQAIKTGGKTLEPLEVGHNVYRICNMGLLSTQLGRKLEWDDQKECFVNDNAANAQLNRPVREKYLMPDVVKYLEKNSSYGDVSG